MALRNLVAIIRTPAAAAALRLPGVSPAAGSRPLFTARQQHGRRTLDFESATVEEIKRETELLWNKVDETMTHVGEYAHIVFPRILMDMYMNVKLFALTAVPIELLSLAVRSGRSTVADSQ